MTRDLKIRPFMSTAVIGDRGYEDEMKNYQVNASKIMTRSVLAWPITTWTLNIMLYIYLKGYDYFDGNQRCGE